MKTTNRHLGRSRWTIVAGSLLGLTVLSMIGPLAGRTWDSPAVLFSLVVVSAVACVLAAATVIAIADRREMAEVGLLGALLVGASVMPLVHGLLTPEVLFPETEAFRLSSFLTLPVMLAVGAPLVVPDTRFGRWAARHWRDWTLLAVFIVFVLASAIVFFPDAVSAPGPRSPLTVGVTAVGILAIAMISARQMRFYELGRRRANLVASISLALLGVTAATPLLATAYTVGFWWTHVAGALGVLGVSGAMSVSNRLSPSAHDVLAPILSRDPFAAFELGLSSVVHDFVAELDAKDEITRDHVVRTGELAMRVGERFRLSASEVRDLGLAAMLHDVGKVNVPDSILKKPARLTAEEYETMKLHPVDGEAMLAAEPALASAARIVRHHHERFDGGGYPDGLVGREIPLASRIIAVCDAFDAMTHDRQYRAAMPMSMAFAILREHAGSQWDEQVVEQVLAVVPTMPSNVAFDQVGRGRDEDAVEIPDDISSLLQTLDAEI